MHIIVIVIYPTYFCLEILVLNDAELVTLGQRFFDARKFEKALWCFEEAIVGGYTFYNLHRHQMLKLHAKLHSFCLIQCSDELF